MAQNGAACALEKLVLGLCQRKQVPQKIQHLNPAAGPLWRSLRSVLAAILVGLAAAKPKKNYYLLTFTRRPVQNGGRFALI